MIPATAPFPGGGLSIELILTATAKVEEKTSGKKRVLSCTTQLLNTNGETVIECNF